jgi:AraC-like DNA-binding protein
MTSPMRAAPRPGPATARQLRDSTQPAAQVAKAVGYTSEYAFNRAFAKHRGTPPGRYQRAHHTGKAR